MTKHFDLLAIKFCLLVGVVYACPTTAEPQTQVTPLYSYSVPTTGYAPNGNVLSYTDSVNGAWTMEYDGLNRLSGATSSVGPAQGLGLTWIYDSFGNRLSQTVSPTSPAVFQTGYTHWANMVPDGTNHIAATELAVSSGENNGIVLPNHPLVAGAISYYPGGNMASDGGNAYEYDADGRVCAVFNSRNSSYTQYVYDAEGRRTAKLAADSLQCYTAGSSSRAISLYVLGQTGEQLTELDSTGAWLHTNVYAAGKLLATYDGAGLHFPITDPLGTVRVWASAQGAVERQCTSLPFGDVQHCNGSTIDPTEHHFTGKERDTESGLDYFGKRFYGSNMGRWMSPDVVNVTEERMMNPSSTLNKYAYAANNPLKYIDPDGQDVTYFYDPGGIAGHAVLFAYNQATGDSAIESFGPVHSSPVYKGESMYDMNTKLFPEVGNVQSNYASITIQTTPEVAQEVISFIREHPDPSTWTMFGPNCSSEVQKLLKQFKLTNSNSLWAGRTPKILWSTLLSRYNPIFAAFGVPPKQGRDDGSPRSGLDMYNLFWMTIKGSEEQGTVTTKQGDGWVNCGGNTGTPCPK